jgi:hypothetical protein
MNSSQIVYNHTRVGKGIEERIAEVPVLHLARQKLGILSRKWGQWHTEMERVSAAEVSWAKAKGMWWSPSYARW